MRMPRFAAEFSLYRSKTNYSTIGSHGSQFGAEAIVPQLPPSPGCGDCTPYTGPDGTRTGVCHQSCCDLLGRCTDKNMLMRGRWGDRRGFERCLCSVKNAGSAGTGSTGRRSPSRRPRNLRQALRLRAAGAKPSPVSGTRDIVEVVFSVTTAPRVFLRSPLAHRRDRRIPVPGDQVVGVLRSLKWRN